MLEALKADVVRANQRLVSSGLVVLTWGTGPQDAVDHAIALEAIAKMARLTEEVCAARPAPGLVPYVGEKHYQRKHGKNAYYGQGGR